MVDSSFPGHISHWAFQIPSNLTNLSAKTLVLGLPHNISPFPSVTIYLFSLPKHLLSYLIHRIHDSMEP